MIGRFTLTTAMVLALAATAARAEAIRIGVNEPLTGPLAQFGRPGLVRDLAGRIAAEFAHNLDARLSGVAAPAPAGLNPLRLLLGLARARLAAWFGRA